MMDPQHRLFLECAWEALKTPAYSAEAYDGLVGVFGGSGFRTYLLNNILSNPEMLDLVGKLQLAVGNDRDSLASTVSYKLNLQRPERRGADLLLDLAGGDPPGLPEPAQRTSAMSRSPAASRSRAPQRSRLPVRAGRHRFAGRPVPHVRRRGAGQRLGNGVAVVVLKRLDEALADGDHIYAVIRGSAINNDGIVRAGYTAPGAGRAGRGRSPRRWTTAGVDRRHDRLRRSARHRHRCSAIRSSWPR